MNKFKETRFRQRCDELRAKVAAATGDPDIGDDEYEEIMKEYSDFMRNEGKELIRGSKC